jgi:hypothetical protein
LRSHRTSQACAQEQLRHTHTHIGTQTHTHMHTRSQLPDILFLQLPVVTGARAGKAGLLVWQSARYVPSPDKVANPRAELPALLPVREQPWGPRARLAGQLARQRGAGGVSGDARPWSGRQQAGCALLPAAVRRNCGRWELLGGTVPCFALLPRFKRRATTAVAAAVVDTNELTSKMVTPALARETVAAVTRLPGAVGGYILAAAMTDGGHLHLWSVASATFGRWGRAQPAAGCCACERGAPCTSRRVPCGRPRPLRQRAAPQVGSNGAGAVSLVFSGNGRRHARTHGMVQAADGFRRASPGRRACEADGGRPAARRPHCRWRGGAVDQPRGFDAVRRRDQADRYLGHVERCDLRDEAGGGHPRKCERPSS